MGHMKDLLITVYGGGEEGVEAAQKLATVGEWVPVSERLPEPGLGVLIFFRATDSDGTPSCIGCDGNGGLITVAAMDRIDGQCLWTSEYGDETPTHWMPLPEPPDARDRLREQWVRMHRENRTGQAGKQPGKG